MMSNSFSNQQRFIKPVTVIIPVYNATSAVQDLIKSIEKIIPESLTGLQFIISDDCSTDKAINDIYSLSFFSRKDVSLVKKIQNLGFVKNVNSVLTAIPNDQDVVILNSDTKIYNEIFSVLQQEAYSEPNIASVTPLTNNGTIASLFNWPVGGTIPKCINEALLADTIINSKISSNSQSAPIGIGFCMYLRRDALKAVGIFDESYGRGYGEEADWSRRAVAKGYKHLISCKAFVYHASTKSFTSEFKTQAITQNSQILGMKHPDYHQLISRYIKFNPLKFQRITLLLQALQRQLQDNLLILMTLHIDPDEKNVAGTERHVNFLSQILFNHGHSVLKLFPGTVPNTFVLRGFYCSEKFLEESFHVESLPELIYLLSKLVNGIHVHHTLYWPANALQALQTAAFGYKIITVHDFYLICPSVNLLRQPEQNQFCEVESNLNKCNDCLHQFPSYKADLIEVYRQKNYHFLQTFDRLIFPSTSTRDYIARGFGKNWEALSQNAVIQEHDISALISLHQKITKLTLAENINVNLIVFVGHLGPHKGFNLILEALPDLMQKGYEVKIFGQVSDSNHPALKQISVIPYHDIQGLLNLLQQYQPGYIGLPALCAETFCYAFYEALLLAPYTLPIVGPFGHPADVVNQHHIGVVMKQATAAGLIEACMTAKDRRIVLLENKLKLVNTLSSTKINYAENYLSHYADIKKPAIDINFAQLLQSLARQDKLAISYDDAVLENQQLRQTKIIEHALKVQDFLTANPRIKQALKTVLNIPVFIINNIRLLYRRICYDR